MIAQLSFVVVCLASSFVLSCSTSEKHDGCNQFKNGNYIYHFRGQQYQTDISIRRQDSIQIETDKKNGEGSKLSIKWTGDCSYELRLIETTFDFPDSVREERKRVATKTQILSWTSQYYIFQTTRDNSDFILKDTLWIDK